MTARVLSVEQLLAYLPANTTVQTRLGKMPVVINRSEPTPILSLTFLALLGGNMT